MARGIMKEYKVSYEERLDTSDGEYGYWQKQSKFFTNYTEVLEFKKKLTTGSYIRPASHIRKIKVFVQDFVWRKLKG